MLEEEEDEDDEDEDDEDEDDEDEDDEEGGVVLDEDDFGDEDVEDSTISNFFFGKISDIILIYYEYNLYSCNTLFIFVINFIFSKLYGLIDSKQLSIVFHSILLTSVT